jgi:hypothetical protein
MAAAKISAPIAPAATTADLDEVVRIGAAAEPVGIARLPAGSRDLAGAAAWSHRGARPVGPALRRRSPGCGSAAAAAVATM